MPDLNIRVLLVGTQPRDTSYLVQHLERSGCACKFAESHDGAMDLLREQEFQLVLGQMSLGNGSIHPLIKLLEGSSASLFFSLAVEDGCWWLPAVRRGRNCFGAPALRPKEFLDVLGEVLREVAAPGVERHFQQAGGSG